jgi:hypothetical protein
MDTTQVTQVPASRGSTLRRWLIALVATIAVAGGIVFGVKATAAEPAAMTPAFAPVSVAPGHTQPATTIYRIAMHPAPQRRG